MRKKLLLLILSIVSCVCLAFGVSACGGNSGTTSDWENGIFTVETAYAEAQELGYSGTLDEFIATISGENGLGISSVALNSAGELVVTFTDSSEINLGVIKGADGADGQDGKDGADGVSISKIELNENGELIITLSDGSDPINLGVIVGTNGTDGADGKDGENGADGVSISKIEINDDGELIITLSDGSEPINLGVIVGTDGTDGTDGADGKDGVDGTDGVSISKIEINDDGELVITLSDGNAYNLGVIVGADGTDGADGVDGQDGEDGSVWYVGEDVPSADLGKNSDMYLDSTTYDIYQKLNDEWSLIGNIKGVDGTASGDTTTTVVTLSFDLGYEDATEIESIQVTKGESVDLPEPEREGYSFIGWYYGTGANAGQVTNVTPITRDMTITAQWERVYNIEITDIPAAAGIYNSAWFYGTYEGGFVSEGNGILTINIIADGETYTATQAYNLGIINGSYSYCFMDGSFECYVIFAIAGDYSVQVVYENSSAQFDDLFKGGRKWL